MFGGSVAGALMEDLRFHHLGLATRRIETEAAALAALGYRREGPAFTDPAQGVQGQFVVGPGPRIELVAPSGVSRTLEPWLAKGIKLYHHGFEVSDLDGALQRYRAGGAVILGPPTRAVAFDGRRIAFLMLPSLLLIELIELGTAPDDQAAGR